MIQARFLFVSLLASLGCASVAELPPPSTPLVATPADARREAPTVSVERLPELPEGRAHRIPDGGSLWVAQVPSAEYVRLMLVSRRGEDGAHVRGLTGLVARHLGRQAADGIQGARGGGGSDTHGTTVWLDVEAERFDEGLAALRAVIREPIDAEKMLKHREEWIDDLRDAGPSERVMMAGLAQLLSRDVPVERAHHERIRELRAYDAEAAEAVRVERFAPSASVLVAVGPHDPAMVWSSFQRVFGDWRVDPPRRPGRAWPEGRLARAAVSEHSEGADVLQMLMVRRAPALGAADRPAFDVLTELSANAFTSRLMTSLREQERVTYGAHGVVSASSYGDVLYLTSAFAPDEAARGMERFFTEVRRLRTEPVAAEELEVAVRRVLSRLRHELEGLGAASFLADAWKAGAAPGALLEGYLALRALRPAELQAVARRTLDPSKGLVLVMGDLDDVGGMWIVRTDEGFALRDSAD